MSAGQVLDVLERLVLAAGHPDIAKVEQFDGAMAGLTIGYRSGAAAYLSPVTAKTIPAELPADLPEYKYRPMHALRLLVDLLQVAQPAGWRWRTVGIDAVSADACGLEVDGPIGRVVLRVIGGSPTGQDANPGDWADWRIPDAVRTVVSAG